MEARAPRLPPWAAPPAFERAADRSERTRRASRVTARSPRRPPRGRAPRREHAGRGNAPRGDSAWRCRRPSLDNVARAMPSRSSSLISGGREAPERSERRADLAPSQGAHGQTQPEKADLERGADQQEEGERGEMG